jgi:dihydrofolate synthase/folylpolyglutamate synthase
MTSNEAVAWVSGRRSSGHGFDVFRQAMAEAGDPQDGFASIHVAGTNGKGSVVCFLKDILTACGFRIGMYTSPHLVSHLDRIRLADRWIPAERFLQYLNEEMELIKRYDLSMFEIDTLIASLYYRDEKADWAVIETGLGGRLDSTNVLHHPRLEVITTIGFDHMDRLGSTLTAIAGEKAGIIKPGSRVVMGYLDPEAAAVIRQKAAAQQAELIETPAYEDLGPQRFRLYGQDLCHRQPGGSIRRPMRRSHCARPGRWASTSQSDAVKEAVRCSRWPGRFEPVAAHPLIILDGAHNPQGMAALTASFAASAAAAGRGLFRPEGQAGADDGEDAAELLRPSVCDAVCGQPRRQLRSIWRRIRN